MRFLFLLTCLISWNVTQHPHAAAADSSVERFALFEATFQASGNYANPYTDLDAEATLTLPDQSKRTLPLFWDGGNDWKMRVSPDLVGKWSFNVQSADTGLNSQQGEFTCVASERTGSIQAMPEFPHHFQYQNGTPMWFMGDTAWGLFTDDAEEKHDRQAAKEYLKVRASQGFNVVHTMMLSETDGGNEGRLPFQEIAAQTLNPAYFREIDHRVAYANQQGIVVGLALAWGDKRRTEPYPWRRFPNVEARKRYARYVAARFSAYDIYFLVSGEWNAEIRSRKSSDKKVKQEFIAIGNALAKADAHDRMIGIHALSKPGNVREFNEAKWMSFADYQQNYAKLHEQILQSRRYDKPVVNAEYGYYLRDMKGDGKTDKSNSTSANSMRHASWDIVMAGGYFVTGFGSTYFAGHRDPGPFNLNAKQNDDWEMQVSTIKQFFSNMKWWQLTPKDDWLSSANPRGKDTKELGLLAPPPTTYWLLAEPKKQYIVYARGISQVITIDLGKNAEGDYKVEIVNPRTGTVESYDTKLKLSNKYEWTPPDNQDWLLRLVHQ